MVFFLRRMMLIDYPTKQTEQYDGCFPAMLPRRSTPGPETLIVIHPSDVQEYVGTVQPESYYKQNYSTQRTGCLHPVRETSEPIHK